jgi:hypothetical protein
MILHLLAKKIRILRPPLHFYPDVPGLRGGERDLLLDKGELDRSLRAWPRSGRPRAAATVAPYEALGGKRLLPIRLPPLLPGLL